MPVVSNEELSLEVVAMAALSLGLSFAGSCNADVAQALMTVLMERPQATLQTDSMTRLIVLGVGLLYLGKQQVCEPPRGDGAAPPFRRTFSAVSPPLIHQDLDSPLTPRSLPPVPCCARRSRWPSS